MKDIEIPESLFTAFNEVTYFDEPHKYYVGGKELISVTTILHKYQKPFDEEYWSENKAQKFGIKQSEVKRVWKFINKKGTIKGSCIHDYAENLFQNKVFKYSKELILNEFGFDPVINEYNLTKKHVDRFYNDAKGKLIPIKMELVVYDKESLIGGMIDAIFYNVKTKEFQIYDWKTNKGFSYENKWNSLLDELGLLQDCDLEVYSLQLSLYKYIIEKACGIKLGKSCLVWFSHNNENYKIIETIDRSSYVRDIINKRIIDVTKLS